MEDTIIKIPVEELRTVSQKAVLGGVTDSKLQTEPIRYERILELPFGLFVGRG